MDEIKGIARVTFHPGKLDERKRLTEAAMIASLGWGDVLAVAPILVSACAVCAAGSLAMARGAPRKELSHARGNAEAAGIPDRESQKLK